MSISSAHRRRTPLLISRRHRRGAAGRRGSARPCAARVDAVRQAEAPSGVRVAPLPPSRGFPSACAAPGASANRWLRSVRASRAHTSAAPAHFKLTARTPVSRVTSSRRRFRIAPRPPCRPRGSTRAQPSPVHHAVQGVFRFLPPITPDHDLQRKLTRRPPRTLTDEPTVSTAYSGR